MSYCPHCLSPSKQIDSYADIITGKIVKVYYCLSCHKESFDHSENITDPALIQKHKEYIEKTKHEELQRYIQRREEEISNRKLEEYAKRWE